MLGDDIGENAATHEETGGDAHEARLRRLDQIVEDLVGDGFVKAAFVAERPDVQFQAFEFDAGFFRNEIDGQRAEVGLAGFRAQTGEFRDFHVDQEIAVRCRVGEGFEGLGRLSGHGETVGANKMLL